MNKKIYSTRSLSSNIRYWVINLWKDLLLEGFGKDMDPQQVFLFGLLSYTCLHQHLHVGVLSKCLLPDMLEILLLKKH